MKRKELKYSKLWVYWNFIEPHYKDASAYFADWLDKKGEQELINISENLRVECIASEDLRHHEKCPIPELAFCRRCEYAHYSLPPAEAETKLQGRKES